MSKYGRDPLGQAGRQSPSRNLRSVSALSGDHPSRGELGLRLKRLGCPHWPDPTGPRATARLDAQVSQ
jgi:hypothetical protein